MNDGFFYKLPLIFLKFELWTKVIVMGIIKMNIINLAFID